MAGPPSSSDIPITGKGCAWIVGLSLLAWFALAIIFFEGMT